MFEVRGGMIVSMRGFELAMMLAKKIEGYMSKGELGSELIEKAEKVFGFKLSPQHYKYYKEYGTIEWKEISFTDCFPKPLKNISIEMRF